MAEDTKEKDETKHESKAADCPDEACADKNKKNNDVKDDEEAKTCEADVKEDENDEATDANEKAEATGANDNHTDEKDVAEAKPDKKDLKIAELNDKYLRLFAEFDNFRKRSEAEKSVMFSEGEKTVLLKVLPLIDNFERALDTLSEEDKKSPFADGIEKVYRAFMDQLKQLGVIHIEAVGSEFDANLHNAVMHVEDENQGENIVVEEFQKGYMFGEKVLRYSMVKVAN